MGENLLQREKLKCLLDKALNQNGHLRKGGEESTYFCFACHHHKRKMEVNLDSQKWECWVCHAKGRSIRSLFYKLKVRESYFEELYKIVGKYWVKSENKEKRPVNLFLPDEFIPLWKSSNHSECGIAMSYLQKRGITMDDILRYNIGYCEGGDYRQRVLIPSYDGNGDINFFAARAYYEGNTYKYMLSPWPKDIIGFELFINWDYDYITITEGPIDAIMIRNNAIPLFGTIMSDKLKEKIVLSGIGRVNLMLDGDKAGINGAIKIYDFLQSFDIDIHLILLNKKDAADTGFEEITKAIDVSTTTTFNDIIKIKLNYV